MKTLDKASNLPLNLTGSELQSLCRKWAARSTHYCGEAAVLDEEKLLASGETEYAKVQMASALKDFFTRMADGLNDPKTARERNEFLAKAQKDPKVRAQMCALRIETYQNYAIAHQQIIPFFFEQVALLPNERPVAQNETTQQIRIVALGDDGEPGQIKIVKPQTEALLDMEWISTEEVEYQVIDKWTGSVVDAALATIQLAYDMANERERRAFALLNTNTVFGNFNFTTGAKQGRTANLNSRINPANLPTSNDIEVQGTNADSNFRTRVLLEICKYADRWAGAFPGRNLMPTGRILIPAGDIADLGSEFNPTGAQSNPVSDQVLEDGYGRVNYNGKNWTLVPDNTLAPGVCYPEFNIKVGRIFTKPSLDQEIVDDSVQMKKKNRESRLMKSLFGAYINFSQRPFVARFTYRTA